jgi:hypothetical protein
VVGWDLHVESAAAVAQVLTRKHGALLSNEERSRVCVATDVVGADGQVGDLEALDAVDIQALVKNTVLDDGVAVPGSHGAGTERVPGGLDVACGLLV